MKQPTEEELERSRKQIELIHHLAVRLPWVVVTGVLLTVLFYLVKALLSRQF